MPTCERAREAGAELVLDAQQALRVRVLAEDRGGLGFEELLVVRGRGAWWMRWLGQRSKGRRDASRLGPDLLPGEGPAQEQQAEPDQRADPVQRRQRREVVEEDLGRRDGRAARARRGAARRSSASRPSTSAPTPATAHSTLSAVCPSCPPPASVTTSTLRQVEQHERGAAEQERAHLLVAERDAADRPGGAGDREQRAGGGERVGEPVEQRVRRARSSPSACSSAATVKATAAQPAIRSPLWRASVASPSAWAASVTVSATPSSASPVKCATAASASTSSAGASAGRRGGRRTRRRRRARRRRPARRRRRAGRRARPGGRRTAGPGRRRARPGSARPAMARMRSAACGRPRIRSREARVVPGTAGAEQRGEGEGGEAPADHQRQPGGDRGEGDVGQHDADRERDQRELARDRGEARGERGRAAMWTTASAVEPRPRRRARTSPRARAARRRSRAR